MTDSDKRNRNDNSFFFSLNNDTALKIRSLNEIRGNANGEVTPRLRNESSLIQGAISETFRPVRPAARFIIDTYGQSYLRSIEISRRSIAEACRPHQRNFIQSGPTIWAARLSFVLFLRLLPSYLTRRGTRRKQKEGKKRQKKEFIGRVGTIFNLCSLREIRVRNSWRRKAIRQGLPAIHFTSPSNSFPSRPLLNFLVDVK